MNDPSSAAACLQAMTYGETVEATAHTLQVSEKRIKQLRVELRAAAISLAGRS